MTTLPCAYYNCRQATSHNAQRWRAATLVLAQELEVRRMRPIAVWCDGSSLGRRSAGIPECSRISSGKHQETLVRTKCRWPGTCDDGNKEVRKSSNAVYSLRYLTSRDPETDALQPESNTRPACDHDD